MKRMVMGCLALFLLNSYVYSQILLYENFEDGVWDSKISVSTVGSFYDSPGIKPLSAMEGNYAFGAGRSTNRSSSFDNYVTFLTIQFSQPVYIQTISWKEMELYDDWGSGGSVLLDNGSTLYYGILGKQPFNSRIPDSTFRNQILEVDKTANQVVFKFSDITDLSEIFIDDLTITGIPEPTTLSLLVLGAVLAGRKRRNKH
jgi:hypothetical protein